MTTAAVIVGVGAPADTRLGSCQAKRRRRHAAIVRSPLAIDPGTRPGVQGIAAVWSGSCSATVELARLAGPHEWRLSASDAAALRLPRFSGCRASDPAVRAAVYEFCLVLGSPFDIYRWVNLPDLAGVWQKLSLPPGVKAEWRGVLVAAGLLR